MKPDGCNRENCFFRHAPAKKGSAMVSVATPKAKPKSKAEPKPEPAAGGQPSINKLCAATKVGKAAQALVASIKEQRKSAH